MQEKTKAETRRRTLDTHRKGTATVAVAFAPRDIMFVKDCPGCGETCPYTLPRHQFACKGCITLFN